MERMNLKFHSVFEGCVDLRLLQMTIFKILGLVNRSPLKTTYLLLGGLKEGISPIPLPVEDCGNGTDDKYSLDKNCFDEMKCCSDSCQKLCVQPPRSLLYISFVVAFHNLGTLEV